MKRAAWFVLGLLAALAWSSAALAQSSVFICVQQSSGIDRCAPVSALNPLPVVETGTPTSTQDVNLKQVGGATVATGNGTAAGSLRVSLPTDGTGVVGLIAGSAIVGKVGIDQTTPGTTNLVAAGQNGTWTVQPGNTANTTAWLTTNTPSSAAGAATTSASSTVAASNLVLKGSAGNLYSLTITIGATSGYAMLFDATALPSNGAVTPVWCYPVTSNGTNGGVAIEFATPKRFGTGITAGFSTTGCFTLTASATGNFFGGYQ